MSQKIYYKVIRRNAHERISIWVNTKNKLSYPVGSRVKADPMSAGIFVFKTRKDAEHYLAYLNYSHMSNYYPKIIRVKGHGPAKQFKRIPNSHQSTISEWFYQKSWGKMTYMQNVSKGTVAFMEVTTLE